MREFEIWQAAANILDPQERGRFLDRECGNDQELRERVAACLANPEDTFTFDTKHPYEVQKPQPDALNTNTSVPPTLDHVGESASSRIGAYRLLRKIGEGGMGSVWLAEQREPIQRTVALKIIKAGMDSAEVIARFDAERQALARMDHPNIAKVLDAGVTEKGRPFFVMELVKGVPLTTFCDEKCMTTEQRLKLFQDVCYAIQHAHQKGIIHRDIKPSNVLVMEVDGEAVPKVIDFGLAKATDSRLTDKTLFTKFGQMVGTPAYMSPEQAEAEIDIDSRTDVYSLGVLMYEMLTGVTPLDILSLRGAALREIQRLIREKDPPRMSQRISSLGVDSAVVAGKRSTDSRKLLQKVRGDLDVIAMKALEKDRKRRYETPGSLAADIQRYLDREVIEARPASSWYRIAKFWQRNRLLASTASVVAVTLVAASIVSTWQAVRASRAAEAERVATMHAKDETERATKLAVAEGIAKDQAIKRLEQIQAGTDILGWIFKDIDLREVQEGGKTLEQILGERLKTAASKLSDEAVGDKLVVANLQGILAESLSSFGHIDEAIQLLEKATATRETLQGPDHQETLIAQHNLAECYIIAGQYERAIPIHEQTLQRSRKTLGDTHYDTLSSLKELGNAYIYVSNFDKGIPLLEEAVRLCRKHIGEGDELLMTALNSLAVGYQQTDKLDLALPLYEETYELRKKYLPPGHYDTMTITNNLSTIYYSMGEIDKALPMMKEVFEQRKSKLGMAHPHTLTSMSNLAVVLEGAGKREEALPYFEEALKASEEGIGVNHPSTIQRVRNLANCVRDLGDTERALDLYQDYVDRSRTIYDEDSLDYSNALIYLGFNLVNFAKWEEAEPVLRRCLTIRERELSAEDWRIASTQSLLGGALTGLDRPEEAEPLLISGYTGQKSQSANMPSAGRAGIDQALDRLIEFYKNRSGEGDQAELEKWMAEKQQ